MMKKLMVEYCALGLKCVDGVPDGFAWVPLGVVVTVLFLTVAALHVFVTPDN